MFFRVELYGCSRPSCPQLCDLFAAFCCPVWEYFGKNPLLFSCGLAAPRHVLFNPCLFLAVWRPLLLSTPDPGLARPSTLEKVVAAKMVDQLVETAVQFPGYVSLDAVATRYGIDPRRHSGEEYLHLVAQVRILRSHGVTRRGMLSVCHFGARVCFLW